MCGRYELHTSPAALALAFGLKYPPEIQPRYNIAPTQQVPVIRLNANGESHLLRETMSGVEGKLPRDGFLRIHRSAIVNLAAVRELQPGAHGDFVVVLQSGKRLPLSRGCRERLEEALGTA